MSTQYSTSSFKIRARAYNAAGWGEYSQISANGTGAWSLGATSQSQSCTCTQGCSCGSCNCGTNSGTQTATGSQSRTCYQWTRSGSTGSSLRNANGTDACSSSYGACGSCGTYGGCTNCSGCTAESRVFADGTYNGTYYYAFGGPNGEPWLVRNNDGCGYCLSNYWSIYSCTISGSTTYRVVYEGCINVGGPKC